MPTSLAQRKERTLKLIERLIKTAPDERTVIKALKMRGRLSRPMDQILAKVPGENVKERAKSIGISRQAWYGWLNGTSRPNLRRAKKLAQITGFSVAEIRGIEEELQEA